MRKAEPRGGRLDGLVEIERKGRQDDGRRRALQHEQDDERGQWGQDREQRKRRHHEAEPDEAHRPHAVPIRPSSRQRLQHEAGTDEAEEEQARFERVEAVACVGEDGQTRVVCAASERVLKRQRT